MATTRNRRDIYQEVTDTVIAALEQGVVPWSCPWDRRTNHSLLPSNATTGRPYNGINVLLLWVTAHLRGYPDSRWLTFKQAQAAGGQVRKRVLDPADFGLKRVGHLGIFARRNSALWPALIADAAVG